MNTFDTIVVAGLLATAPSVTGAGDSPETGPTSGPADAIVARVDDSDLRALLADVLERNPGIAAIEARTAAAGHRSVSSRKLPDPMAEITAFVLPPETRVGPQRASARVTQRIPGGGKRDGAAEAAELERDALAAEIQALRLELVTRARGLAVELGYLDEARLVLTDDRALLAHYEELARSRYVSGSGLQMDAVRIQAEMTRLESRISQIDERRSVVVAELNQLRDRPGAEITAPAVAPPRVTDLDRERLVELALASRPELAASNARISRTAALGELAARDRTPDYSVGLTYAWVDPRTDADVPDNGRDIFGISGGISIPVWTRGTDAEVEAHVEERLAREAARRATVAEIRREIEALAGRIPEIVRRLALLEEILPIQSEQALASAEAAYTAGRVDALALLDAERTLLDVRLSAARGRADLAIAYIELEGSIAAPVTAAEGSTS
jgi:outer membrane protein TolC